MRMETTKSFLLIILIGVSLLLTFGLWTYQPSEGDASLADEDTVSGDLGGTEETIKTIVEPQSLVFHSQGDHYGFPSPQLEREFYEEVQRWKMSNFREKQNISGLDPEMEMEFSDALPMTLANILFNLDQPAENLPNWSFNRVLIDYEENSSLLEVTFVSVDQQRQASAVINDASSFELFQSKLIDKEDLIQYIHLSEGAGNVYLPSQAEDMTNYSLSVVPLNEQMLVNSLFRDPTMVSRSLTPLGQPYFSDAVRELKVVDNGRAVSFINPNSAEGIPAQRHELLQSSMDSISDHGGWTDDYKLLSIDRRAGIVRYQMFYADYPVFDKPSVTTELTRIEQEFKNGTLVGYQRPLFRVTSEIAPDPEPANLDTGEEILTYLRNDKEISLENIEAIRLGYQLTYKDDDNANFLSLEAKWYMNYKGSWKPVREENKDAMESN
jgi:regulatory protein YycH of two-component signal transduction system YycFG